MIKHSHSHILRVRLGEFILPPIEDGLVLGRESPIGPVAVGKALSLLSSTPFEHVPVEDDEIIGDLLIRTAILRKIQPRDLVAFVLREIRPLMGPEEILHLQLDLEVQIESKTP
ncbi:hypothetical protein [Thiofaba sp. EF100]|jgi:hypothetical protein|uniref:hypothetical protein n=1 Tax=Thiofaba sp. EF100 TaxID=3121274 RepID=UPI003221E5C6